MWDMIDKYQTLIAGLFAIVAAVIAVGGLYWQTHKDAANRREEAEAAAVAEKLSILAAFDAEIGSILALMRRNRVKMILKNQINSAREQYENNCYRPNEFVVVRNNYTKIYDANASKIGLLGSAAAKSVVQFYASGLALIEQLDYEASRLDKEVSAIDWLSSLELALNLCASTQCYGCRAKKDIRTELKRLTLCK